MSAQSPLTDVRATLAADRAALRSAVDSVPAAMRDQKPAPDRWSVAEVLEHLGLVEARVVMAFGPLLQNAPTRDGDTTTGATAIDRGRMRDRENKIVAPPPIQPTGSVSAEDAWATLQDTRVKLLAMLDAVEAERRDLAQVSRPHPVLGPLDGYQWVAAIGGHEERHTLQIHEIAAALEKNSSTTAAALSSVLGRPLWYELMTTDTKAAEAFYKDVIGWAPMPFDVSAQPYTMFMRAAGIPAAGLMARPADLDALPFWAMYVGVPKLEVAAEHIKQLGGKECSPIITVPNIGRMQMMMDPQGAAFYLYEPASQEQMPEAAAEVGEASWHELVTTDASAAMTFYSTVFGWAPGGAMDMGPMGKYHIFNRPIGSIGGMMNKPAAMAQIPSNWQIYFRVGDLDAAIARITANGGRILNGPMEVPGGDRIVNAMDPQGAAFSLHARKAS